MIAEPELWITELELRTWDLDWMVIASMNNKDCICVQFQPSHFREQLWLPDWNNCDTIQEPIAA